MTQSAHCITARHEVLAMHGTAATHGVALSWCSLKRAAAPKKATLRFCPAPKEGLPAGATTVAVPPALQGKHVAAAVAV